MNIRVTIVVNISSEGDVLTPVRLIIGNNNDINADNNRVSSVVRNGGTIGNGCFDYSSVINGGNSVDKSEFDGFYLSEKVITGSRAFSFELRNLQRNGFTHVSAFNPYFSSDNVWGQQSIMGTYTRNQVIDWFCITFDNSFRSYCRRNINISFLYDKWEKI